MSQSHSHRIPEEPHGDTAPLPHHYVNYYAIFGALVVLTIITVAVAFLNIRNEGIKVALALTIAAIKASCVALFFMHLKFEGKMIYTIAILPLVLCVLLVVALIPDILMIHGNSSSLHLFNEAWVQHLIQGAMGGE
jgi:cytochrome c oxidase subunit IV